MYQVTQETSSFEWSPEQEKALHQVQAAVQASLPLGPYDPGDPRLPPGHLGLLMLLNEQAK